MRTNSPVPSVPMGMPMNSMTYSASLPLPLSSIPSTMTLPASVSAFPQAGAGPFPELPSNLPQPLLPLSGSIPPPLASQSGMNPFLWEDLIGNIWCIPYFFTKRYGGSPVQSTFVLKQAPPWKFWSKRLSMNLLAQWDIVQKTTTTTVPSGWTLPIVCCWWQLGPQLTSFWWIKKGGWRAVLQKGISFPKDLCALLLLCWHK